MRLSFFRNTPSLIALVGLLILLLIPSSLPALAMTASCQAEMDKVVLSRQSALERVNGFAKKKPTASQACSAFGALAKEDKKLLDWMTSNKDWCQVPDQFIEQMTQAQEQGVKIRNNACTAAKNEADMRRNAAPSGAPPPGAGVRLPKGAL